MKSEELYDELLLKDFSHQNINEFHADFSALVSMIKALDSAWAEADNEFYAAIDVFREYIEKFNEKYSGLKLKFINSIDQGFRIFIFFPEEKTLIDVFNNSAGKIYGLAKIGTSSEDSSKATLENLKQVLPKIKDKMFILYHKGNSKSLILEMDKKEKMPELVYGIDTIGKDDSAEFVLCAYYALKNMKNEIDIKSIFLRFPSIANAPNVDNIGALKG